MSILFAFYVHLNQNTCYLCLQMWLKYTKLFSNFFVVRMYYILLKNKNSEKGRKHY